MGPLDSSAEDDSVPSGALDLVSGLPRTLLGHTDISLGSLWLALSFVFGMVPGSLRTPVYGLGCLSVLLSRLVVTCGIPFSF